MLTTIANVKSHLIGVGESVPQEHEEQITRFIKRKSIEVEEFCRRRLVKTTHTGEQHTGTEHTEFAPDEWPINAISSVTIDGTAVVAGAADDQYTVLKGPGPYHEQWALYRKAGWTSDPHRLLITYTAGYVLENPTGADVLIREDLSGAVDELVAIAYLLRAKGGFTRESFEGLSVDYMHWPAHILQALAKYQRPRI